MVCFWRVELFLKFMMERGCGYTYILKELLGVSFFLSFLEIKMIASADMSIVIR